jgi:hypothetical protein
MFVSRSLTDEKVRVDRESTAVAYLYTHPFKQWVVKCLFTSDYEAINRGWIHGHPWTCFLS